MPRVYKILSVMCVLALILALSACGVHEPNAEPARFEEAAAIASDGTQQANEPPVEEEGSYEGSSIQPRTSYLIVDEAITQGGSSWTQPEGYKYYRVWIDNNTDETMKIIITYGSSEHYWEKTIAANSEGTVLNAVNAADGWEHNISFSTPSGELDGTVQVRVSDTEL